MCECIKNTSAKLLEHVSTNRPEKNVEVEELDYSQGLQNTAFMMNDDKDKFDITGTQLYTEFHYRFSFEKKDGSRSRAKLEKVKMFFTYCPFCGKPYKAPKA